MIHCRRGVISTRSRLRTCRRAQTLKQRSTNNILTVVILYCNTNYRVFIVLIIIVGAKRSDSKLLKIELNYIMQKLEKNESNVSFVSASGTNKTWVLLVRRLLLNFRRNPTVISKQ